MWIVENCTRADDLSAIIENIAQPKWSFKVSPRKWLHALLSRVGSLGIAGEVCVCIQ